MRVISLASGSSGNALLVEAGPHKRTRVLIDAGLSAQLIAYRLHKVGVHPSQLQGVLVTHEHKDHTLGLPMLMKRYSLPVIADPQTYQAIEHSITAESWPMDLGFLVPVESIQAELVIPLPVGSHYTIGDIEVTSFPIPHDAVAPCGYLLSAGGCRVCVVTDCGEVTPAMLEVIQRADLLILEANHDRERLLRGPYPNKLKQRILSSTGHLSNDQAAETILRTWRSDSIRWLWLSHLSRTNNTPTLARESIRTYLQAAKVNLNQVHILVSPPAIGHVWDTTQLWKTSTMWEMPG